MDRIEEFHTSWNIPGRWKWKRLVTRITSHKDQMPNFDEPFLPTFCLLQPNQFSYSCQSRTQRSINQSRMERDAYKEMRNMNCWYKRQNNSLSPKTSSWSLKGRSPHQFAPLQNVLFACKTMLVEDKIKMAINVCQCRGRSIYNHHNHSSSKIQDAQESNFIPIAQSKKSLDLSTTLQWEALSFK